MHLSFLPRVLLMGLCWVGAARGQDVDTAGASTTEAARSDEDAVGSTGFVAGARIGLMVPGGPVAGRYFQPGALARGEVGIRFLKHFGVKGFFGASSLATGRALGEFRNEAFVPITTSARAGFLQAGASLFAISSLRHLGLLGEIGLSPLHQYRWSQTLSPEGGEECRNHGRFSGVSLHSGGSITVPLGRSFVLAPTLTGSIGQLFSEAGTYECEGNDDVTLTRLNARENSLALGLFLGLGGDFYFGDR